MKTSIFSSTGKGCLAAILAFAVLSLCLCPLAMGVGGFTSSLQADAVARVLEPYLCPAESTAEIITYQTTSTDEFGNESPATGFEMQCVAANGELARSPGPEYAFYWVGLLVVVSLVLSALLALLLVVVASWLLRRYRRRLRE